MYAALTVMPKTTFHTAQQSNAGQRSASPLHEIWLLGSVGHFNRLRSSKIII